jgi:hypothetical protein
VLGISAKNGRLPLGASSYLNFIIENFPSLPILSEICSAISNLSQLERAALRSQEPNPFKTWFLELIFCYIRYLCNQDTIVLQQILLEQKRQQEEFALLTELDELKSEAQAKLILRNIDLLTVASLYKELEAAKETCYQVLQLTKANELEFWRKLIRDDEVFSKVLLALEAKYRLLREGQELVARMEKQLATTNLPAEKRQRMEDQVQAYKDHVRLSSPENIQKYIPHHLLSDPDKIPVIVQKGAATEELAITSLRKDKSENKQAITEALLSDPDKILAIVQKGVAIEEIAITSLRGNCSPLEANVHF